MQLQLTWDDPVTEEPQQRVSPLPIAFGRELEQLPREIDGQQVHQIVLLDTNSEVSRYHALIFEVAGEVILEDRSTNGTTLNEERLIRGRRPLTTGDTIRIGTYNITIALMQTEDVGTTRLTGGGSTSTVVFSPQTNILPADEILDETPAPSASSSNTIINFNPETDNLESQPVISTPTAPPQPSRRVFPPADVFAAERVSINALHATGYPVEEIDYTAIGGGMGSFVWVDTIRICGVKPDQIRVLTLRPGRPYERYEALLRNCQIPRYKRIRSGSDSCPDNVWGWPGYALREAWRETFSGRIPSAISHLWEVFSEPAFADTYTPIADNVFNSMDREAARIGWDRMVRYGSVRAIRKTEDGRYVIAYSATKPPAAGSAQPPAASDYRFLVAKYIHLSTGYPAIKLLNDLQDYRQSTGDTRKVVHGYEPHDHVYEYLEKNGGTIVIRGFGIVGSQIMDRVYKARMANAKISVIHLSRSPKAGNKFGVAKRYVENHWEFQPFNWPKGTWGGDMRSMLEAADPLRRRELLEAWGGTTTASRGSWRQTVKQGLKEGWYTLKFGQVDKVELNEQGKPVTYVKSRGYQGIEKIEADFVVDCTGLVSDPRENPLLKDLIEHHNLDLNPQMRFHVENDFEIKKMRNDKGRMYAAGVITLGGPYAPVDTFLGLQYAAHRSAEALAGARAPKIGHLEGIGSIWQWLKWAANMSP
ncbi:MAG: FHA domain-containing protein [Cyanobacteria bacterium CRU_2_1]|nr:FHA domain-containing protein [Cyanobacteria bacterium RU_5_0]NJR60425.1 FHA domain-containing protein [Cyanobacteria bacterium CRU_2_1]